MYSDNEQLPPRAVLWLDLAPKFAQNSTRSFLFRVTTEAHPWGYNTSDEANRIPHEKMRTAIEKYGNKERKDLKLTDTWPIDAIAPVPFAWLMRNINKLSHSEADFWDAIIGLCKEQDKPWSNKGWVEIFNRKIDEIKRAQIFAGLNYANKLRIVALEVPEEVLKAATPMEIKNKPEVDSENIANVEHLFQRLNAGGTRLDGEELAYSMIKAYLPEVEEPIEALVAKRMPASRLAMLGTRMVLSIQKADKWSRPLTVSAMRELALHQEKRQPIRNFFQPPNENELSIKSVLEQVDKWLGDDDPDDIGLPPVMRSAMARNAPDVYLLLMWLAYRFLPISSNQTGDLRKRLIGLATALHWFGEDRDRAVAKLYETISKQENLFGDATFKGILRDVYKLDSNKIGLHPIPTPDELDQLIVTPKDEETLKKWHWWGLTRSDNGQELSHYHQALQRIKQEKSEKPLLLYAQRKHLKTAYPNYDPARQDLWEQHNRPWDYDHILASKIIYGKWNIPNGIKEWAYNIANLRAWPMEDNRSDQHVSPKIKLNDPDRLTESFIDPNELDGFEQGFRDITDCANAIVFVDSAKKRLLRIYREWYDTLDIGFLI